MRVFAEKVWEGNQFRLLVRAEEVPEELQEEKISLSRNGVRCFFCLNELENHDGHAPLWEANGRSPVGSSCNSTAEDYMDRICNAVSDLVDEAAEPETEEVEIYCD